jgi:hypothetical protein
MAQTVNPPPTATRSDWPPEPMGDRILVRCFSTYGDARRAVDRLRVARIPERRITVTGRGITVRPALTAERSARLGGALGALVAAATALLLWGLGGLVAEFSWLSAILAGGFIGGAVGTAIALMGWRVSRDAEALPEASNVDVSRYDLLVERRDAQKAFELLGD